MEHADENVEEGDILLNTLGEFPFDLNFVPGDARTILNTPTVVITTFIQRIAGGEYLHIGFKFTLEKKPKGFPGSMLRGTIIIDFSTDRAKVDICKRQFWALQYRIFNILDQRPVIAGIFVVKHKPTNAFDVLTAIHSFKAT